MTTTSSLSDFQPVFFTPANKGLRDRLSSAGIDDGHSVTTASSIADRVTTILHPSYEAYLVKFFSHSHLPLCTEDSVVLKSVSISKPWRGGQPETIVSPSYHTGDYHLSLCTHDSFILFHELCSHRFPYHFVVPDLGPQAGFFDCFISIQLILRESRYCREQQTAYSFQMRLISANRRLSSGVLKGARRGLAMFGSLALWL